MLITLILLLGCAGFIYLSCEFFINGIEWLGHRLRLSQTATGSILAALGTALPESVVTLVAVAFSDNPLQKEIGIGAAFGGPLALSTVAYATVGLTALWYARRHASLSNTATLHITPQPLQRDQQWFLMLFIFKLALGLIALTFKPWLGLLFIAAYCFYSWKQLSSPNTSDDGGNNEALEPLKFSPGTDNPHLFAIILQVGAALTVIFFASRLFVNQIEAIGSWLDIAPQLAALLLSPLATELPEVMNAIIWTRQGKTRLALANISGAMMIQTTLPTALGIFFTPWQLTPPSVIAASITIIAMLYLQGIMRSREVSSVKLAAVMLLYPVFIGAVIFMT